MADALDLFDPRRSKWCDPKTGVLTREAQLFLRGLWLRVGGAIGPTTNDLTTSQFEDAGIEEIRSMLLKAETAAGQDPASQAHATGIPFEVLAPPMELVMQMVEDLSSRLSSLEAEIAAARKEIAALQEIPA